MQRITKRAIFKHIAGLLIFIAYDMGIVILNGAKAPIITFFPYYILDVGMFYFMTYLLLPYAFRVKPFFRLPLLVLPLIFVYCVLSFTITSLIYIAYNVETPALTQLDYIRQSWRGLYISGLSLLYFLFRQNLQEARNSSILRVQKMIAEQKKTLAENAYLQARIHPHFLFNSLNYIYDSVEEIAPEAADAIHILSEIMRYSISIHKRDNLSTIDMEVQQIKRLVNLNQRINTERPNLIFEHHVEPGVENVKIPNMILATFVDNVFKHGNLSNSHISAKIFLSVADGVLHFTTENLLSPNNISDSDQSGIDNVRKILDHAYPGRFLLDISIESAIYKLKLQIRL